MFYISAQHSWSSKIPSDSTRPGSETLISPKWFTNLPHFEGSFTFSLISFHEKLRKAFNICWNFAKEKSLNGNSIVFRFKCDLCLRVAWTFHRRTLENSHITAHTWGKQEETLERNFVKLFVFINREKILFFVFFYCLRGQTTNMNAKLIKKNMPN